jgi:hypothetical protein
MPAYRTIRAFSLLAVPAALLFQLAATDAFAGKEVFKRTKPHVNVATIGNPASGPAQPMLKVRTGDGGQDADGGLGGPRKDKIDLSVCELGTFDFDKCLN